MANYDIAEIKKEATKIKNTQGSKYSIIYLKNIIDNNNLEFNHCLSLLKKLILYLKKEKNSTESILNFLDLQFIRFYSSERSINDLLLIGEIYSRVTIKNGLDYLVTHLNSIEKKSKLNIEHFDLLMTIAEYYLLEKMPDLAFQTVRKATIVTTNFEDKYLYIYMHQKIATYCAKICLARAGSPNYADYVYYEIVSFILGICSEAAIFPNLENYFWKKELEIKESSFLTNDDFRDSLKVLKILSHSKELINEINEFAFIEIPTRMGIQKKYLIESNKINWDTNSENFILNDTTINSFRNKPFTEIATIHLFAADVVKKYYDLENVYP